MAALCHPSFHFRAGTPWDGPPRPGHPPSVDHAMRKTLARSAFERLALTLCDTRSVRRWEELRCQVDRNSDDDSDAAAEEVATHRYGHNLAASPADDSDDDSDVDSDGDSATSASIRDSDDDSDDDSGDVSDSDDPKISAHNWFLAETAAGCAIFLQQKRQKIAEKRMRLARGELGHLAVFAEEWPARFAANNALRSWDEVLRRCNRHERDQVRVRICHAERLGIDTDRLNLPSFRYDDPGKPSTWEGLPGWEYPTESDDEKLLREDRAWQRLNDAILLAEEAATTAASAPASTGRPQLLIRNVLCEEKACERLNKAILLEEGVAKTAASAPASTGRPQLAASRKALAAEAAPVASSSARRWRWPRPRVRSVAVAHSLL